MSINIELELERLNKLRPQCFSSEELDDRLFAHIHFDHRLSGTHLQGNVFKNTATCNLKMLQYLIKLSDSSAISDGSPSILPKEVDERIKSHLKTVEGQFTSLVAMETLIEKYKQEMLEKIKKSTFNDGGEIDENYIAPVAKAARHILEEKGELSLPGGWTSEAGGHAMCYQFIKETEGPNKGGYTFLIYNTGDGIQYHQETTQLQNKRTPIMGFSIPPSENSLDSIERFMKELISPNIKPECRTVEGMRESDWDLERLYDAKRLYTEVFPKIYALGGTPIDMRKKENKIKYTPITTLGQLSGSCTMRVLMPYLHVMLKSEAFQQYLYQFRLQTIVDYFRIAQSKGLLERTQTQRELREALKKFGKTLDVMMHRTKDRHKVLSEKQVQEGLDWVQVITTALDKAAPKYKIPIISDEKVRSELGAFEGLPPLVDTREEAVKPRQIAKSETPSPSEVKVTAEIKQEKEPSFMPRKEVPKLKPEDEKDPLQYLKKCYEALSGYASTAVIINEAEKMFLSFPLEFEQANKFWKNLKSTDAKQALHYLQSIQRIYAKQCGYAGGYPLARQTITSETARLSSVFILNRAFNENKSLMRLSDTALRSVAQLNEAERVSFDPKFDQRIKEVEKLQQDLLKHNSQFKRSFQSDEDYFDIGFVRTHLSETDQKKLQEHPYARECSVIDRMRLNLYELAKKERAETVELSSMLKEYDIFLQFKQFNDECSVIKNGGLRYFNDVKTDLTDESRSRLHALGTSEVEKTVMVNKKPIKVPDFRIDGPYKTGYNFNNSISLPTLAREIELPDFLNISHSFVRKILFGSHKNSNVSVMEAMREPGKLLLQGQVKPNRKGRHMVLPQRRLPFTRMLKSEGRIIASNDFASEFPELFLDKSCAGLILMNYFSPELLKAQIERNGAFPLAVVKTIEEGLQFHSKGKELMDGGLFFLSLSFHMLHYFKAFKREGLKHPSQDLAKAIARLEDLDKKIKEYISYYEEQFKQPGALGEEAELTLAQLYTVYSLRSSLEDDRKTTAEELNLLLKARLFYPRFLESGEDRILSSFQTRNLEGLSGRIEDALKAMNKEEQKTVIKKVVMDLFSDLIPKDGAEFWINYPDVSIHHPDLEKPISINLERGLFPRRQDKRAVFIPKPFDSPARDFFGNKKVTADLSYEGENEIYHFTDQLDPKNAPRHYKIIRSPFDIYDKSKIFTKPGKEARWFQWMPDLKL